VRTNWFPQINDFYRAAPTQIDNFDRAAIGTWFADTGIPVDRDIAEVMVRSDSDLVTVDIDANFAEDFSLAQVHDKSGVVPLIGDKQEAKRIGRKRDKKVLRT
jgi:hypothetical protein